METRPSRRDGPTTSLELSGRCPRSLGSSCAAQQDLAIRLHAQPWSSVPIGARRGRRYRPSCSGGGERGAAPTVEVPAAAGPATLSSTESAPSLSPNPGKHSNGLRASAPEGCHRARRSRRVGALRIREVPQRTNASPSDPSDCVGLGMSELTRPGDQPRPRSTRNPVRGRSIRKVRAGMCPGGSGRWDLNPRPRVPNGLEGPSGLLPHCLASRRVSRAAARCAPFGPVGYAVHGARVVAGPTGCWCRWRRPSRRQWRRPPPRPPAPSKPPSALLGHPEPSDARRGNHPRSP